MVSWIHSTCPRKQINHHKTLRYITAKEVISCEKLQETSYKRPRAGFEVCSELDMYISWIWLCENTRRTEDFITYSSRCYQSKLGRDIWMKPTISRQQKGWMAVLALNVYLNTDIKGRSRSSIALDDKRYSSRPCRWRSWKQNWFSPAGQALQMGNVVKSFLLL